MLPKLYLHASLTFLEVMPSARKDTSLKSIASESVVVVLDVDKMELVVLRDVLEVDSDDVLVDVLDDEILDADDLEVLVVEDDDGLDIELVVEEMDVLVDAELVVEEMDVLVDAELLVEEVDVLVDAEVGDVEVYVEREVLELDSDNELMAVLGAEILVLDDVIVVAELRVETELEVLDAVCVFPTRRL